MVALLGDVEASGFYAYVWDDPERPEEDGQKPHPMLGASFHRAMLRYWDLVHGTSAHTDPYAVLPEDPAADGEPFSPTRFEYTPDHFARATLAQVRRYLSLLPRGERFSEGYIGQQVESGAFRAALERLRELRTAM